MIRLHFLPFQLNRAVQWICSITLLCVTLPAFSGTGGSRPAPQDWRRQYLPNVIVLRLAQERPAGAMAPATGSASLDAKLRHLGVYALESLLPARQVHHRGYSGSALQNIYLAHYHGQASPQEVAATVQQDPHVVYAEPKYLHQLAATPNDPNYGQQDFYAVVGAEAAWEVVKGEQGNVVIGIIDGGTDIDHPDLAANLWRNPSEIAGNGLDDDGNGFIDDLHGWNFANNSGDPSGLSSTPGSADHGTHTAGLAAAVTNNSVGVAGMSWNARILPVCVADPGYDNVLAFGYEGVLYAAVNGADLISLSWGRLGAPSAFEQDLIDYVSGLGVAVIAAAGNDNTTARHYPSAYRNVLAVANTTNSDRRHSTSNYGTWVDLTAPGDALYSTYNNSRYAYSSGTSMSCPLVAGAAALVKTQHPTWSGRQVAEQVRVTADNIDALNPGLNGLLGKGRLNARRAVTETVPAVRLAGVGFTETNGDGIIQPGETVTIHARLINYLAPAANLALQLVENDAYVNLTSATATVASLGTLQEMTVTPPFVFTVASNAPSGHPVNFTLRISGAGVSDVDFFELTILPTFGTLNINNVATTVTNVGRLGFADPGNSTNGIGFRFMNGPNLLFEGALLAGTGAGQISNAARGIVSGSTLIYDQDFVVATSGELRIQQPGVLSDQESIGVFEDKAAGNPMNLRISQETFARNRAPDDDFIILRYTIENLNSQPLANFHCGFYFDWDIDESSALTNIAEYDAARRLGYSYDNGSGPGTYAGMSLLTAGNAHYRAIYNNERAPANPSWGLYDGFTDQEKWEALSGGAVLTKAGPEDVSFVLATGPHILPANGTLVVGFALLAGTDLADLRMNADAAQQHWDSGIGTAVQSRPATNVPLDFGLAQNHPNPYAAWEGAEVSGTTIGFALPRAAEVWLEVFDLLGRPVRTLLAEQLPAGRHQVRWDGRDQARVPVPNGVYIYRLRAGEFTQSRKLMLLR